MILRVIMPLVSQPTADGLRVGGLGDVMMTAFFSPARAGRITWGAGPVFLLPAATNNHLGAEKFGLGPSIVVLTQPGPWTVGMLFNQRGSLSAPRGVAATGRSRKEQYAPGKALRASCPREAHAATGMRGTRTSIYA